jgi:hypothetical protein
VVSATRLLGASLRQAWDALLKTMKQVSERIIKLAHQDNDASADEEQAHGKYAFRWAVIAVCVAFWIAAALFFIW